MSLHRRLSRLEHEQDAPGEKLAYHRSLQGHVRRKVHAFMAGLPFNEEPPEPPAGYEAGAEAGQARERVRQKLFHLKRAQQP